MAKDIFLILHNIRSMYNVGSIFRTADAANVKKIFLTGYTPAPLDGFGKIRPEIHKTALGAEYTVDWEIRKNIGNLIKRLKLIDIGCRSRRPQIAAVEQSPNSVDYKKFRPKYPLVLVFGNEVRGLARPVLAKCDKIIEIPMKGKKESLNVSVCAGIILFSLT